MSKNPLDELESLLKERPKERTSLVKAFIASIPLIRTKADEWFNYEVGVLEKEMGLLENVIPERIPEWTKRLEDIKSKFSKSINSMDKTVKEVEEGKIISLSEIYRGRKPSFPTLPTEEEKVEDLTANLLDIFDSAQELEKLINEVETEARRTLLLRRLLKIELDQRTRSSKRV
ncbi:MAG: hypothetical protein H3Z52_02085 [archaeon]|nr:hypothetical protein [archaeon]MCP8317399.1 hypothetical protein [archaeon]MCP8319718.1 hypothetical protein [archaeon]